MSRYLILVYAGIGYVVAMLNLVYFIGFIADVGVPKSIAHGATNVSVLAGLSIDTALVLAFGGIHSLMARRSFKRQWCRVVPAAIERATYLYVTAVTSALLIVLWQPIAVTLWEVESLSIQIVLGVAYLTVWSLMLAATFHFGHFDFLGLAQAWRHFRRRPVASAGFAARYLYALVRHPISLGWMVAPWLVPHFTLGHLVFALSTIAYILTATYFEERDLIAELGADYRDYRRRVPAFLPTFRRQKTVARHPADLP